jgi:trans-aconitate methyltransferase
MGFVSSNEPQAVVHRTGRNMQASQFYTGLIAEMYDFLVSYQAPVSFFADLIRNGGEPALELGCGTGHPLLPLAAQGLRVEGLDSSRDMLTRCGAKARSQGLHVTLHQQEMQNLALPTCYRTIFFAGASFMLLPDLCMPSVRYTASITILSPEGAR